MGEEEEEGGGRGTMRHGSCFEGGRRTMRHGFCFSVLACLVVRGGGAGACLGTVDASGYDSRPSSVLAQLWGREGGKGGRHDGGRVVGRL